MRIIVLDFIQNKCDFLKDKQNASKKLGINSKSSCTTKIQTMFLIDPPFLLIEKYNLFFYFFFGLLFMSNVIISLKSSNTYLTLPLLYIYIYIYI